MSLRNAHLSWQDEMELNEGDPASMAGAKIVTGRRVEAGFDGGADRADLLREPIGSDRTG